PGNAFLVRMRRSNERFSPASEESSAGPPLPYLFGRGTLLNPETKARGISVRATSIADARRAMSVGLPFAGVNPPVTGVTSFALERTFWDGLLNAPASVEAVSTGSQIWTFERIFDDKGNVVDIRLLARIGQFTAPLTSIGMPLSASSPGSGSSNGYVPIFQAL